MNTINKYQEGGDIKDELTYIIPIVGTKKLYNRMKENPSTENKVDFGLALASDLSLLFGVGGWLKGASMAPRIARTVKVADQTANIGSKFAKGAKEANAVRNTTRAKRLTKGAKTAAKKADDLRFQAEELKGAQQIYKLQLAQPIAGATYKYMIYDRNKPSNYVEKNNAKVYNTFQKKAGGIMKKLIPKHQQGNRLTTIPLKRSLWQILTGEHPTISASFKKDLDTNTRVLTFNKEDSRDKGDPYGQYMRFTSSTGQLSHPETLPSYRFTRTGSINLGTERRTEDLEKEATNNYIQQHNGELPWWYEGSPENPYELDNLTVTSKGTPFTRTYDWYNSGHKYPYTITENVGIDRDGNDSIMSSFMINPQGDSLYNAGRFPEILSPRGESIFNNRLIRKNNTEEARQKFMEDYRRAKKTVTY